MSIQDLMVRILVDDSGVDSGLKSAGKSVSSFGSLVKANLASRAIWEGMERVGSAVKAIGKGALSAYANYEQLVGGVETLFGAGGKSLTEYVNDIGTYSSEVSKQYNRLIAAQKAVMADADAAYKTAGLSANDYMETVTGFAAALNSSLGGNTQKAAEYANMAVVDMADNANKMGTGMESIQNAYQGFAKQNYTMLDNLKLGYGGTKSEMERLLKTANEINKEQGIHTDYQISNYADIVEAIHTVQTNMGITGTTAKEAATTVSGSVNSMKTAWQNWLTGLGNSGADMKKLSSMLFESFQTVVENVKPVAQNILSAMAETLQTSGPQIIGQAFSFITESLPELISTGGALVDSILQGVETNLPLLIDSGIDIALQLAGGLVSGIPELIAKVPELISSISSAITGRLSDIQEAGGKIVEALQTALDSAGFDIDLSDVLSKFQELAPAIAGVTAAVVAFKAAMAIASIIQGVSGAITAFKTANEAATVSQALLNAVMNANPFVLIVTAIAGVVAALVTLWNTNDGFREAVTTAWEAIKATVQTVAAAIGTAFSAAWAAVQSAWAAAAGFFSEIWAQITAVFAPVVETLSQIFTDAWNAIKGVLDTWAQYFSEVWENCKAAFNDAVSVGSKIIEDIKSGISSAWESLVGWFTGIWNSVFGNLSANVSVNYGSSGGGGGRAIGMDYVPYNGFPTVLHRGEAVLTHYEADQWRRGRSGGNGQGITIVQNIHATPQTPAEFAATTQAYFQQARWAF